MPAATRQGSLNINSENMFPIIRKWLYQDHDIFMREQISNGTDAVTKLRKLALIGEYEAPADEHYRVVVTVDPEARTISFDDNGIGMTADEVDNFINQVAFSGAADFLEKYKDRASEDQIIGHFGLGFYSAFMVADKVTIDTLSFKEGAEPVLWESEDGTEFTMGPGSRKSHGTTITLHLTEDELKYSNIYQARETIEKYCAFMPVEIYLLDAAAERKETEEDRAAHDADADAAAPADETAPAESSADASAAAPADETEPAEPAKSEPKPVNDINPLWNENPSRVTEEQYKEFYTRVFRDWREPLFWIHLNMDYPFRLKGILYFPRFNNAYESIEGVVKLYNNQVFIADNIKEVIPEYLLLLKGCIDCPDLPLNVSRSALQNDGFVQKISDYITRKVSDKLTGMMKTDRENYEKYWDDISPFIKFGCIRDDKFGERMKDAILFKDIEGRYLSLDEYTGDVDRDASEETASGAKAAGDTAGVEAEASGAEDAAPGAETDAADTDTASESTAGSEPLADGETAGSGNITRKIYYVTDEKEQAGYIERYRASGRDAVLMKYVIDTSFIPYFEAEHEGVKFIRIDAELSDDDIETGVSGDDTERLIGLIRDALGIEKLKIEAKNLKDTSLASVITISEESRRMEDMMRMYGIDTPREAGLREGETLTVNLSNPLVQRLSGEIEEDKAREIASSLYDLALLNRGELGGERLSDFIRRTGDILLKL